VALSANEVLLREREIAGIANEGAAPSPVAYMGQAVAVTGLTRDSGVGALPELGLIRAATAVVAREACRVAAGRARNLQRGT